ncbi:alpha/beta hydrolase, partial [Paenibacillus sp. ISL-20]|uniref:alpha/beta fold hydrolase n=1 Tax=Paenibacillus sp. ISL-20 TaxID=2819163 RepID=UPI001BED2477
KLFYRLSHPDSDCSLTPLLICPGLSETAEEYQDLLEYLMPRRCIVLSFRGRGQSGTPPNGYDLKDHVTDIESVVKSTGITPFHLYAFSRGVSYALEYTRLHPDQIGKNDDLGLSA